MPNYNNGSRAATHLVRGQQSSIVHDASKKAKSEKINVVETTTRAGKRSAQRGAHRRSRLGAAQRAK